MEYVALLREYGFPIMVCAWFMWRLETKIDKFNERIHRLSSAVSLLAAALDVKLGNGSYDDNGNGR